MRYRQGGEAYRGGRYRESIDYFLEADRLSPSAALSFNIARAYEKTEDDAAALRWYRDYLRRDPTAKDRADVERLIHSFEERLVKKGVQQITVLSDPALASVSLDEKPVGVTPWTGEIPPGTHQLELVLEGHDRVKQSVELSPDHAIDVTLTLPVSQAPAPTAPSIGPRAEPAAKAPEEPRADARSTGLPLTTLGYVGLCAGGAALTGALVFELLRRGAESDAKKQTTQLAYVDRLDTMESRQTTARILAGAGAALAVAGGVLLWVGSSKGHESSPSVSAACMPGTCWSTVRGRF
jgi:tetratricopeptide (TPR) repeat protein